MSKRREANRAEAIVRDIGALIMLLVLMIMVKAAPAMMKGKNPQEAISVVISLMTWFALLGGAIIVIGVVVWLKILRGGNARGRKARDGNVDRGGGGSGITTVHCPECGSPMVLRKARYGRFWGCSTYPACTGKTQFSGR